MVQVKISETYDLSTEVDKIGIIGVHTPSIAQVKKVWGNLFECHQRIRFASCDVTMACASMLPADPLQIGTESGSIAPQDMFNPILYTAVSNDSFNALQSRIYGLSNLKGTDGTSDLSISYGEESSDMDLYYGLLADPDMWRKTMPQSGLEMRGLYPLVYQVVNTFGNTVNPSMLLQTLGGSSNVPVEPGMVWDGTNMKNIAVNMRGPAMKMPSLPTKVGLVQKTDIQGSVVITGATTDLDVSPTYVACIVMPPAKLNKLYYRMKVTWTIEFTGLRSNIETQLSDIISAGGATYGTDYAEQSKMMDQKESSIDVKNADLQPVMVSTR